MTQKEVKEKLQSMVDKASALELELVWIPKIMSKQTSSEIMRGDTIETNKVGLSGYDGRYISSIYNRIQDGQHLSENQASASRKILRKYWKQYHGMMNPTIKSGKY
jgi:hypothetical protein